MLFYTCVIYADADVKLQQTPVPVSQTSQSNQCQENELPKLKKKKESKKTAEHKCLGVNVLFFSAVGFDRVRPENDRKFLFIKGIFV